MSSDSLWEVCLVRRSADPVRCSCSAHEDHRRPIVTFPCNGLPTCRLYLVWRSRPSQEPSLPARVGYARLDYTKKAIATLLSLNNAHQQQVQRLNLIVSFTFILRPAHARGRDARSCYYLCYVGSCAWIV